MEIGDDRYEDFHNIKFKKVKIINNNNKNSFLYCEFNKSVFKKAFYGILKFLFILYIILFFLYKINSFLHLNNYIGKKTGDTILNKKNYI